MTIAGVPEFVTVEAVDGDSEPIVTHADAGNEQLANIILLDLKEEECATAFLPKQVAVVTTELHDLTL